MADTKAAEVEPEPTVLAGLWVAGLGENTRHGGKFENTQHFGDFAKLQPLVMPEYYDCALVFGQLH